MLFEAVNLRVLSAESLFIHLDMDILADDTTFNHLMSVVYSRGYLIGAGLVWSRSVFGWLQPAGKFTYFLKRLTATEAAGRPGSMYLQ